VLFINADDLNLRGKIKMKQNRRRNLVSGVAFTCGAILLSSLSAPVVNAATDNNVTPQALQTAITQNNDSSSNPTEPAEGPSDSENGPTSNEGPTDPEAGPTDPTLGPTDPSHPAGPTTTDPTNKELEGTPEEIVVGEDPASDVKAVLSPDQLKKAGILADAPSDPSDPSAPKVTWVKKPDTTKEGKSTGEA
jgi:cytoskeletal protein RodZ